MRRRARFDVRRRVKQNDVAQISTSVSAEDQNLIGVQRDDRGADAIALPRLALEHFPDPVVRVTLP